MTCCALTYTSLYLYVKGRRKCQMARAFHEIFGRAVTEILARSACLSSAVLAPRTERVIHRDRAHGGA